MISGSFWDRVAHAFSKKDKNSAVICDASELKFAADKMSKNALRVAQVLHENGHAAYLVGGCVRDVLLGLQPKDFDVATDAHPETIRDLFRNSRIIGRRFRLVHIYFRSEIIEVSTFRGQQEAEEGDDKLQMLARDNQFGSLEEDAWRRDFTINSLYYQPIEQKILDFTGGLLDIKKKIIRMIGDPRQRFHEDPVRMLRAIRFQAKLGFKIESDMQNKIKDLGELLLQVPSGRLFDENLKLFYTGHAQASYNALQHFGFFALLYPEINSVLASGELAPTYQEFLTVAMDSTDQRIKDNMGINPGFLLAVMLWAPLQYHLLSYRDDQLSDPSVVHAVMQQVLSKQIEVLKIPKRFSLMIQDIWFLQYQMLRERAKVVYSVARQRYFRAAVDFLEFRVQAGEPLDELAAWWRAYCDADMPMRKKLIAARFDQAEAAQVPARRSYRPRHKARKTKGKTSPNNVASTQKKDDKSSS